MSRSIIWVAALVIAAAAPLSAQEVKEDYGAVEARAELIDRDGNRIGEVRLTETPAQGVLLHVRATGLEPGSRAIHIHETGRCDAPTFEAAGGHFNPADQAHGALHEDGMHAGDLLNLNVPADGTIEAERLVPDVTLRSGEPGSLVDGDGTAVVIHVDADDYESQPTGDAGDRVACGVITRTP